MNDNDGEIPEELKLVVAKGTELIAVLATIDDPVLTSKSISIAIAHLLCCRMTSEDAAHDFFDLIIQDIESAVMTTKKYGCTSWVEGTPH